MSTAVKLGFKSLEEEKVLEGLAVQGEMPRWLDGLLLRTGPAKFEVGSTAYQHWFDGLAMLHRFSFKDGRVDYANRFLASEAYREATGRGRIALREFATMPSSSRFRRILDNLLGPVTDNGNVNVTRLAGRMVALTETTRVIGFDPWSLETLGEVQFSDAVKAQVWTAHPHFDPVRRKLYNVMVAFGPRNFYRVCSMEENSQERVVVAEIRSARPSYLHSFAVTERYLVLVEIPLVVPSITLKVGWSPFIENYRWEPERGTRFTVVRKDDGKVVAVRQADPFFTFHHVNAFEEGDELVIDLVRFPDAGIIDALYLASLRSAEHELGTLERFRLGLGASTAPLASRRLSQLTLELPRINYIRHNGRPYRYTYAVGATPSFAFGRILKVDVTSGAESSWSEEGCHPGEPVFVEAPSAAAEDDGVLLSLVLDERLARSFLLCLDAKDLRERARASLPHHVPFGFHGQYFQRA